jgi:predicted GTPase
VHPSVYMILELEVPISVNSEDWSFQCHLLAHRSKIQWTQEEMFWTHPTEEIDGRLKAVRILICGEAGIGKSTLINKVFGAGDLVSRIYLALGGSSVDKTTDPDKQN